MIAGEQQQRAILTKSSLHDSPIEQFSQWFDAAVMKDVSQPEAMALATVDKNGTPSVRMVLLKGFDDNGFQFFTNYQSRKTSALAANPSASLLFFWKLLGRQVRITGEVRKLATEESDAYFATRSRMSQLGAWASLQSQPLANRETLHSALQAYEIEFEGAPVPLPPFWGGYRLQPTVIEFWQNGAGRLHDRFQYKLQKNGNWHIERLYP